MWCWFEVRQPLFQNDHLFTPHDYGQEKKTGWVNHHYCQPVWPCGILPAHAPHHRWEFIMEKEPNHCAKVSRSLYREVYDLSKIFRLQETVSWWWWEYIHCARYRRSKSQLFIISPAKMISASNALHSKKLCWMKHKLTDLYSKFHCDRFEIAIGF